ncbi:MAG: T9SS type A sorting domain-containing protein [Bacteroidia bacterium]|nr:T9SS type A sorting domain-containing protein [Bacteroidia bacterium]
MLEATPFSGPNASGTAGERLSVILEIVGPMPNPGALSQLSVYPNPITQEDQLKIDIQVPGISSAHFSLLNDRGEVVYQTEQRLSDSPAKLNASDLQLKPGIYYLKINLANGEDQVIRLVKR